MLPVFKIPKTISIVDLVILVGFAKSKREARTLIKQGGFRINDVKYINPETIIEIADEVYEKNKS